MPNCDAIAKLALIYSDLKCILFEHENFGSILVIVIINTFNIHSLFIEFKKYMLIVIGINFQLQTRLIMNYNNLTVGHF